MLRGRFENSIDAKGRVSIPTKFKSFLTKNDNDSTEPFIITNFGQCLVVYAMEQWVEFEEKLAKLPQFDKSVVAFQRYFIASAMECQLDKQGRLLIPSHLRKTAGINKECIILGRLNKFEIWGKETWEKEFNSLTEDFHDISQKVADLGINL